MKVRIDSREQQPWVFPDGVEVVVGTVRQGDYALDGDNCFAIERKSIRDFRDTLVKNWDRFQREMLRMDLAGFFTKVIIVEGNLVDYCFLDDNGQVQAPSAGDDPVFSPAMAAMRVAELVVWNRACVLFAHDEGIAAALAYHILTQREKQLTGKVSLPRGV